MLTFSPYQSKNLMLDLGPRDERRMPDGGAELTVGDCHVGAGRGEAAGLAWAPPARWLHCTLSATLVRHLPGVARPRFHLFFTTNTMCEIWTLSARLTLC